MPKSGINKHHRRSIRMRGYDYSLEGGYFVTIGAYQHTCLIGEVINGIMCVNTYGDIALEQWKRLRNRFYPIEFP